MSWLLSATSGLVLTTEMFRIQLKNLACGIDVDNRIYVMLARHDERLRELLLDQVTRYAQAELPLPASDHLASSMRWDEAGRGVLEEVAEQVNAGVLDRVPTFW